MHLCALIYSSSLNLHDIFMVMHLLFRYESQLSNGTSFMYLRFSLVVLEPQEGTNIDHAIAPKKIEKNENHIFDHILMYFTYFEYAEHESAVSFVITSIKVVIKRS